MIRSRAIAAMAVTIAAIALPVMGAAQTAPSLTVEGTDAVAGATQITVPAANLPEDGYIVVHEGDDSAFGGVIGSSALLAAGSHQDIAIDVSRELSEGEYIWPMLHSEGNDNGAYDDPATDPPISDGTTGNANFGGVVVFSVQVAAAPSMGTPGGLTVVDMAADAGAMSVTVPSATLPVDGYIVVHEGDATSFGAVVGSSELLPAGTHENVVVALNREVSDGEYLWPMLHSEGNDNGIYDDPATDPPISDEANGNPSFGGVVTFPMQITLTAISVPTSAPTGNAGLASRSDSAPWALIAAFALATGAVAASARRVTGRSR